MALAVILYALFTNDMSSEPLKIDIEKVVKEKAPKYAKKIPGFLFRYLERTIHQDEINYILKTYKDSTGVKFADDLLSYMNVHINVIGKENIPPEGRFIFASNHPLGALDGVALIGFFGHFYSGRLVLSAATRENKRFGVEKNIYRQGRSISTRHHSHLLRRTKFHFFLSICANT